MARCEKHPIIEEFYRSGTRAKGNRKCFVRIRVPKHTDPTKPPREFEVTIQSHETHRTINKDPSNNAAKYADGRPVNKDGTKIVGGDMHIATIVQGSFEHVVLVGDEAGDWGGAALQFAATPDTQVLPVASLVLFVDQTIPKLRDELDAINDRNWVSESAGQQLTDLSQHECTASLEQRAPSFKYQGSASFGTEQECANSAAQYRLQAPGADAAVFECIEQSAVDTVYTYRASADAFSDQATCDAAAAVALGARDALLNAAADPNPVRNSIEMSTP